MCGRFSLSASGDEVAEAFDLEGVPELAPRFNIAPSQPILVVTEGPTGPQAATMQWGIPQDGGQLLINARSETAATRPAFREHFRGRRCLVPADGFYEWQRGREGSQPYHVRRRDRRVFAMAGLWSPLPPRPGQPSSACAILTTDPNELVAPIHDRMPVILDQPDWRAWLGAGTEAAGRLRSLLRPLPAATLEAVAVSDRVNSTANDGPQCQQPPEPRGRQGLLFPEIEEP